VPPPSQESQLTPRARHGTPQPRSRATRPCRQPTSATAGQSAVSLKQQRLVFGNTALMVSYASVTSTHRAFADGRPSMLTRSILMHSHIVSIEITIRHARHTQTHTHTHTTAARGSARAGSAAEEVGRPNVRPIPLARAAPEPGVATYATGTGTARHDHSRETLIRAANAPRLATTAQARRR
jgi:hypothetical protein